MLNRLLFEPCTYSTESAYTYQQTQVRDENDQQYHSTIVNMYRYTAIIRCRTDMFVIVQYDIRPVHHNSNPLHECLRERTDKDEHQLPNHQSINKQRNFRYKSTHSGRKEPDTIKSRVDAMLANVHASMSA